MTKMLSSTLVPGDVIEVKTRLFSKVKLIVANKQGILLAISKNGDVSLPVSALTFTSRAHTANSIWCYVGKTSAITNQYIDFVEVDHKQDNIQENFLIND